MNADKIITVKHATYTVAKRMLEKLQLAEIWTLTSVVLVQRSLRAGD